MNERDVSAAGSSPSLSGGSGVFTQYQGEVMSTEAEANLTDQRAPLSHAQCIELADLIASLRADVARHKADYEGACKTIADMHAAAVGGIRGPIRGVAEDVADLRAELAASESLVTALREQMSRLAEQHAKAVAEAREEQREQDARRYELVIGQGGMSLNAVDAAAFIRATPLDSTPLAARIAELEARNAELEHFAAYPAAKVWRDKAEAAESALAAEVERHQATAKVAREALEKLRDPKMWRRGAGGQDRYAGMPPAIRHVDVALASLPAGPRVAR